jgi:ribonuclease HII
MAVVVLPMEVSLPKVTDSKKMTDASREEAIDLIYGAALYRQIEYATAEEIDTTGVWGMWDVIGRRLVAGVRKKFPDRRISVDGNREMAGLSRMTYIVGGDDALLCISAASVVAKYSQCIHMDELHGLYPDYGFDRHRGYSSAEHIAAIKLHGAIPGVHRKKYVETLSSHQKFKLKWRQL